MRNLSHRRKMTALAGVLLAAAAWLGDSDLQLIGIAAIKLIDHRLDLQGQISRPGMPEGNLSAFQVILRYPTR